MPTIKFLEGRLAPAVFTVNSALDTDDLLAYNPLGTTTLRKAIRLANVDAVADSIDFDTALTGTTITLTNGEFAISKPVTITGLGSDKLTIDANNASRIFNIDDGTIANIAVSIAGLKLTHGRADVGLPSYYDEQKGGAIFNREALTLASSLLDHNSAASWGGGIQNYGTLTVMNSTLSANSATNNGGGIYNGGWLTVANSTLSANSATVNAPASGDGGGIFNGGYTVTVTGSTLSANSATDQGGAIFNSGGMLTLTNSTLFANSASSDGGGIYNYGTVTLTNSTLSANSASSGSGGGIHNNGGTVTVTNSTLSGNTAAGIYGGGGTGGGIFNGGWLTVTNSTLSANTALHDGGGILNWFSIATLTNSTLSANTASGSGGGIYTVLGTVTLTSTTIVGNSADSDGNASGDGGGIYYYPGALTPALTLFNTIVAGNVKGAGAGVPSDLAGTNVAATSAFNLIGDPNSRGGLTNGSNNNIVGKNNGAVLLPLAEILDPTLSNNGGPTLTHALIAGSLAIDMGDDSKVAAIPFDQRGTGFPRIVGAHVDIGAFEMASPVLNHPPIAVNDTTTFNVNTPVNINVLANDSDPDNDPFQVMNVNSPSADGGTVAMNGDGTVTYSPAPSFNGTDSFTYTVSDGRGGTATATVFLASRDAFFETLAKDYVYADRYCGEAAPYGYTVKAEFNDSSTGFYALGLHSADGGDSVLAFRGTEGLRAFDDWAANFDKPGVGFVQFERNRAAIERWLWEEWQNGRTVALTGHSLGGALAQWVAADWTGQVHYVGRVVTFNSPGISYGAVLAFQPALAGAVMHYITSGDPVSMAGQAYLPGEYRLASFSSDPRHLIQYVLDKHLTPVVDRAGVIVAPPQSVAWLNSPVFHYSDAEYWAWVAGAKLVASLTPFDRLVDPRYLLFRGTTELARESLGTYLPPILNFVDTVEDAGVELFSNAENVFNATTDAALRFLTATANKLQTTVTWTVNLGAETYTDVRIEIAHTATLYLNGLNGLTSFVGQSPALQVASGKVILNAIALTTDTDSPTILVEGGTLVLRDSNIEESTGFSRVAISITGGRVDLGTDDDHGGNVFNVNGVGQIINNATSNSVPAVGNTFTFNGVVPTVIVTGGTFTYDGNSHAATGSVTGVIGAVPTFIYTDAGGNVVFAPVNVGTYAVTASYVDSANYISAFATATINILKAAPAFSLLSSPTIIVGTAFTTLSGKISLGLLVPTGNVTIALNGVDKPAAINADGTFSAQFATGTLGVGAYPISYNYGGDGNFNAAAGAGTLSVTYNVELVVGPMQPKQAGSTIPFQIQVADANGTGVSAPNLAVTALGIASVGSPSVLLPAESPGNANPGNRFTAVGGGRYQYNLKTPKTLAAGTYLFYFTIEGDPLVHSLEFEVK